MKSKLLFACALLFLLLALAACTLPFGNAAPSNSTVTTTAVTTATPVSAAPGEVLRGTPTVDGVLDAAYLSSARAYTTYDETAGTENGALPCLLSKIFNRDGLPTSLEGTFYLLWDDDFVYFFADIYDTTDTPRTADYIAEDDPWISDCFELFYTFGGTAAPAIPSGEDTYPTYNTVVSDSRARGRYPTSAGGALSAITLQKSFFFDDVLLAGTHEAWGDSGVHYCLEFALPAKTESHTGKCVGVDLSRAAGRALTAGDRLFVGVEMEDLLGFPKGFTDEVPSGKKWGTPDDLTSQSKAWQDFDTALYGHILAYGNRCVAPLCFTLSDTPAP